MFRKVELWCDWFMSSKWFGRYVSVVIGFAIGSILTQWVYERFPTCLP